MTDAMTGPRPPQGPREQAEALVQRNGAILRVAVEVVNPQDIEANPLEIFAAPGEVRATGVALELTGEQEEALRDVVGELGFGRETDLTAEQVGLPSGYVAIIEAGQPHKIEAECRLADTAGTLLFAGSPYRKVASEAERASGARVLGIDAENLGATEYDVVRQIAEAQPGFIPNETGDEVLSFGYDIYQNYEVSESPTGQLVKIGTVENRDVVLLRIDRENYVEDGKSKYRFQPGSAAVMGIVSDVLSKSGDSETPVGFLTSATYQPSRDIDGARAGMKHNRQFGVVTYGTATLAEVKGEPVAAPGPINQLPGELHKAAQQTAKLAAELGR